jgi:hypothetical protein
MQDGPAAGSGGSGAPIDGLYRHDETKSVVQISYEWSAARWWVSETRGGADLGAETYAERDAVEALLAAMQDEGYRKD